MDNTQLKSELHNLVSMLGTTRPDWLEDSISYAASRLEVSYEYMLDRLLEAYKEEYMSGKGSKQRPTNMNAYFENFDRVFRRKATVFPMPEDNPNNPAPKPVNAPGFDLPEKCPNCGASMVEGQCINKKCKN